MIARLRTIPSYIAVAIAVIIMLNIFARIDNWRRDWTTNHARLAADADDPDLRPPRLPIPPQQSADRIRRWVESQSHWQFEEINNQSDPVRIHLTRRTRWMRFVDDVRVELYSHPEGTRVEAESQSRIGKGDLGQNPRNLKELVRGITAPPTAP